MPYRREILIAVGVLVILALIAIYYTTLPRAPEATPTPPTPTPTSAYTPTPTPVQPTPTPTREEFLKPIIEVALLLLSNPLQLLLGKSSLNQ